MLKGFAGTSGESSAEDLRVGGPARETTEDESRRRRARWAWVGGLAGLAIVLFFVYLRLSRTYAATSDGADQALQGWDMLHGNWLLRGWTIADVTYYTTEVPEYALVELFRGLRADDVHIAGAATYTLLVLAAGLLARGRSTGREGLIRFALAAGIMIAPQFGNATHLLLSQPDHLGTSLPVLLVFLMLDRAPRRWYIPVAAGVALTWVVIGDRVALLTAVGPLAVVCAARVLFAMLRYRKSLASQWYELSLVAASVVSFAAAELAVRLIGALHGYQITPVLSARMAMLQFLPIHVQATVGGIRNMYGADFIHISRNWPFGPQLGGLPLSVGVALAALHFVGLALAVWGFFRAFRYFFDPANLVSPVLATGIVINVAAYVPSIVSAQDMGRQGDRGRAAVRRRPGGAHGPRDAGQAAAAGQAGTGIRGGGRPCLLSGRSWLRGRPVAAGGQRGGGHSLAGGTPPHQRAGPLPRGEPHRDGQRGPRRDQGCGVAVHRQSPRGVRIKDVLVRPPAKLRQLRPDQQRRPVGHGRRRPRSAWPL